MISIPIKWALYLYQLYFDTIVNLANYETAVYHHQIFCGHSGETAVIEPKTFKLSLWHFDGMYLSVSTVSSDDQTEQCCMKSNAPNEVLAFASPVLLMTHWLILAPAVYPSICCFSVVYLPFYQHYPLVLLIQLPSAALQLTPESF